MYSLSLDAGLLSSFISRNKVDLVIHGHKHVEQFMQVGSSTQENNLYHYHILGLGSTGSSNLAQNAVNSFATLDFNERGFVTLRVFQVNNGNNGNKRVLLEHKIPISKS